MSMELGNCKANPVTNDFDDCEEKVSKYGLIGFEVAYLYNLFDAATVTGKLTLPNKSIVTPDKIERIKVNLKNIIEAVENALYVKNSIVSDVVVYNNVAVEDKNNIGCLLNVKTKRFANFKNSLYSDEFKVDKLHPLLKLTTKNAVDYFDFALLRKKKYGTYICNYKRFNLEVEDLFSPNLFNRQFIKGLKFETNSTLDADKTINPEDCTNLWAGKIHTDPTKVEINYLCMQKTSNFLDNDLITDIKVKAFPEDKCAPFKYNDKDYVCICDKNLLEIPNKDAKLKRFLCYTQKILNESLKKPVAVSLSAEISAAVRKNT